MFNKDESFVFLVFFFIIQSIFPNVSKKHCVSKNTLFFYFFIAEDSSRPPNLEICLWSSEICALRSKSSVCLSSYYSSEPRRRERNLPDGAGCCKRHKMLAHASDFRQEFSSHMFHFRGNTFSGARLKQFMDKKNKTKTWSTVNNRYNNSFFCLGNIQRTCSW